MSSLIFQEELLDFYKHVDSKSQKLNTLINVLNSNNEELPNKFVEDYKSLLSCKRYANYKHMKYNFELCTLINNEATRCNKAIKELDSTNKIISYKTDTDSSQLIFINNVNQVKCLLSNYNLVGEYKKKMNSLESLIQCKNNEKLDICLNLINYKAKFDYLTAKKVSMNKETINQKNTVEKLHNIVKQLKSQILIFHQKEKSLLKVKESILTNNGQIKNNSQICLERLIDINYQTLPAKSRCLDMNNLFSMLINYEEIINDFISEKAVKNSARLELFKNRDKEYIGLYLISLEYFKAYIKNLKLNNIFKDLDSIINHHKTENAKIIKEEIDKLRCYHQSINMKIKQIVTNISEDEKEFWKIVSKFETLHNGWPLLEENMNK